MVVPTAGVNDDGSLLCAICMDSAGGFRLRPCGHNHFCQECALQLFSCPLCRAPLLLEDGLVQFATSPPDPRTAAADLQAVVSSRTVLTRREMLVAQGIALGVWLFIFVGGIVEHLHDIQQSCKIGDPYRGQGPDWLTVDAGEKACAVCNERSCCEECLPGYYNLGVQCFKYMENFPPFKTGAALGGNAYFALIVLTQIIGITTEILLIRRLLRRKLMPRKELVILCIALCMELVRMFLIDIFVMREYFGDRAYNIFRQPLPCTSNSPMTWQGVDSQWYCPDLSPHTATTSYYIADRVSAWSSDASMCSTWTKASPILSFGEKSPSDIPGGNHRRFRTMGWVIGGEFALYYFFATFINEVADIMFVVPTTTSSGWLCKIFSVALEVFQLGALCPAAVFTHQDCLHYTNPLGVPLESISTVVIVFGYLTWGFVFLCLPLACGGCALLGGLYILSLAATALAPVLRFVAKCSCCQRPCCCNIRKALNSAAASLDSFEKVMKTWLETAKLYAGKGGETSKNATMTMAFIPMLCGGIYLGTLVVIGQGSKQGFMQILTAIVLLSDVLFKVVASVTTEVGFYLLHRRVNRIVSSGQNRRNEIVGAVVGMSME